MWLQFSRPPREIVPKVFAHCICLCHTERSFLRKPHLNVTVLINKAELLTKKNNNNDNAHTSSLFLCIGSFAELFLCVDPFHLYNIPIR